MNLSTLSLLKNATGIKMHTGKIMKPLMGLLVMMLFNSMMSYGQTTYTWAGGASASWAAAASWSPSRTTPAANDIMVFSSGTTVTPTAIPIQTIGQLLVSSSTIVNLQSATALNTLTIAGGTGTDLSVASGCQLNISGTASLIISLLTGATGSISGNMTFSSTTASQANQLLAADASGITFNSGATFIQSTNSTGTVFGNSGTANTIVFTSGSAFMQGAGSAPFGLTQPASKVVFQTGSLFKMLVSQAPSFSGRTYANFEWAIAGTQSPSGASAFVCDNLTVSLGTLNVNMTGTPGHAIKGNISVVSGATLTFSPASAGTMNFSGTTAQAINNAGTLTFTANQAVVIGNTGSPTPSVTFNQSQTISGSMTVNAGSILASTGTLTLTGTPAINGSFQINPGGFATGGTWSYGAGGTLIYNTSSNFGENGGAYWPTINGPTNVTVQNTGGITLNVSRSVSGVFQTTAGIVNTNNLTLNGTGKLNTGGFFGAIPVWGASSTLIYNTGGTFGRGNEFSNAGNLPSNVQVSGNTTINYPNAGLAARTLTGNLTIDAGSSFYMDFGNPNPGVGLLTINNLVQNGNLSLGSQTGGDLAVKGNFTRTGTFSPNSRAVFFNAASGNQTITGTTTFDYVIVDKAAGSVVLANNITINQVLTLTNGTVNTSTNKVIVSNNNAAAAVVRTNGYINGNLQRAINTGANTYLFAVGTATGYTPASLAFTAVGGAGNITMSSADAVGANYPASLNSTARLARSWSSINSGVTGITGSATFTYLGADLVGGATSGSLKAYVHDGSYSYPTSNSNTASSFTFNGLTTVGEFGAGNCKGTLAPTFTKTMVSSCGGGADGTITVTPAGGTAPYSYSWTSTPAGFSGNTALVTGLSPRDYTVVVSEATTCSTSIPDITIFQVFATVVTNNGGGSSSCGNTGYITLYGSGGVQPYTYSINGTNYFASNSFTLLAAGTYTGYVKDLRGCISTKPNIVVTGAAAMVVTANTRPASACANNGTIELYRTGGVAPYTYSLDDVTYQGSNVFSNKAGGTYTGWVKDASGCKTSLAGIVVAKAPAIVVTSTKTNTSACSNSGAIQLSATGGTPGYTYSITGAAGPYQVSNYFSGLAAGSYNGWVQDSRGCKNVQFSIVIGTNPAPTITVTSSVTSASSCANNGSIQLFRTGGTGPYTYSITAVGGPYQASSTFTGLAGGTYTGWVKDVNGCTGSLAGITVGQSPAVTAAESHTNTSSCANDGTIQLTPGGGVPGYTYSLNNITYQAGNTFTGLAAGNFTGWVKDSKGCTASVNGTIGQNAAIVVTAYAAAASSCETSNGSIQLFRTGGTGPYTYSITATVGPYQASNIFPGLTAGNYTGYVKDSKGCVGSLNIAVGPNCLLAGMLTKSPTNTAKVLVNNVSVKAYPNPSAAEFTLKLEGFTSDKVSITVTDILGRKVYQAETNSRLYTFGNSLRAGIYTVQVVKGNQKQSIKLIKE